MSNEEREALLAEVENAMRLSTVRGIFFHQAVAQRAGMTASDLNCVNILVAEGPLTAGQLAVRVGLTRGGAITSALDRLEKAGYVVRERDPADRRQVLIRHTDAVIARLEPLLTGFLTQWTEIATSRTDHELRVLLDYFQRSNEAVGSAIAALQER
ncbi:MarR family winged helix-turn-helix transcriptional regulator [Amycolatopsis rubida]|uniref:MarR family winged helix-turn-helix transcriptional regulator n=1 Tax=Amycolatopsis rubida TaxID=112413 RepID=UPI00142F2F92|nr:MarR family transcriptional regulator [Amycolatopsis rubida]